MNMTQDVINAVKEAKEQSKPRNFTESVDIIINIRDLDVNKPENRFNEVIKLGMCFFMVQSFWVLVPVFVQFC
jgi:ribosomal protein L1